MISALRRKPSLNRREKRLALGVLYIAAAALFYVYLLEPRIEAWVELEKDIAAAQAHYQKLSILVKHEEEIRYRYSRLRKSFASKGTRSADRIAFYQFLGGLDSGANLQVQDIRPVTGKSAEGNMEKIQAVVFAEGTIEGVEALLGKIADAEQALRVEKLIFSIPRMNAPLKIIATVSKSVRKSP